MSIENSHINYNITGNIEQYLHGINVHPKDDSEPKSYFLLNDVSNEDRVLRFRLHQEKLNEVLQQQQVSIMIQVLPFYQILHNLYVETRRGSSQNI